MATKSETESASEVESIDSELLETKSQPYIGRWNQLVSTTNWEKGRIIYQWREELIDQDAEPAEYSDETWSRLVGGVTGQHVGRLRRVYQRFAQVYEDYAGLYWSHFHAALDWDDAEMWLEGAVQNSWSVSQMRRTRWETLGSDLDTEPSAEDIVKSELDEDFEPALEEPPVPGTVSGTFAEVESGVADEDSDEGGEVEPASQFKTASVEGGGASIYTDDDSETVQFVRPFENLSDLPDDLADAFEAYKLAILRHKAEDWKQISKDDLLASLDALKELVLAPAMDDAPF